MVVQNQKSHATATERVFAGAVKLMFLLRNVVRRCLDLYVVVHNQKSHATATEWVFAGAVKFMFLLQNVVPKLSFVLRFGD